jgi:hypothetical protein
LRKKEVEISWCAVCQEAANDEKNKISAAVSLTEGRRMFCKGMDEVS